MGRDKHYFSEEAGKKPVPAILSIRTYPQKEAVIIVRA
jgi:hypothetical protein